MAQLDTTPYWIRTSSPETFQSIDRNVTVDVAIVGGGIVGITTAYLLKAAGLTVALLERHECASIDSGHTTAHLTMVTDLLLSDIVDHFDRQTATAVWDAGRVAIDQIEANIQAENIDCQFERVPGFLHTALMGEGESKDSLRQQAELATELGFPAAYQDVIHPFGFAGTRFDNQALFHPRRYLAGLLATIAGDGSHVFEYSNADEVTDDPLTVKSGEYTVSCGYVVLATHNPIVGKANVASATLLQTKLALYTSYALGGRLPAGQIPHGLYWDTADPYHYLRVHPESGYDYLIFGGEDHKTGQASDTRNCYAALEETLRRVLPTIELTDRWSGQVIETNDGLPFIGETAEKQFAATGFAGNGMTFGTLSAIMARDAVMQRSNAWKDIFDPGRTKIRGAAWDYVRENKDFPYYLIRDRLATKHATSLRGLRPGQGKVVDINGQRTAAFRDEQGAVTLCSAVCTHMGCDVHWNQAETTWDCPCHGSRFKTDGTVISGPAETPLEAIE
ncbi:MAG TPA: FAD-dependent oxidoreductase [Vicinamibacterales bacterium]|nr:FAD-dependent oxidoreductase [Vicinamibacterales bacterium]